MSNIMDSYYKYIITAVSAKVNFYFCIITCPLQSAVDVFFNPNKLTQYPYNLRLEIISENVYVSPPITSI